jgi:hypothetical protein
MLTETEIPTFRTVNHHAVVRALTVVALCAALAGGFLAQTWRAPAAQQPASDALVHCQQTPGGSNC